MNRTSKEKYIHETLNSTNYTKSFFKPFKTFNNNIQKIAVKLTHS